MIRAVSMQIGAFSPAVSFLNEKDPSGILVSLEKQYPDFRTWYFEKVLPGIAVGRRRVLTRMRGDRLVGLAIAKRETERKLCTLWVDPAFRGHGIAAELADEAFDWIGSDRPLFTVPEEQLLSFSRLLRRWAFNQTQVVPSYYRLGKHEHVFNGKLEPTWPS